ISVWHNTEIPEDVNSNGGVEPLDALIIINDLNANGPHSLVGRAYVSPYCTDTNNDYSITPLDPLVVINFLNAPKQVSLPATSFSDPIALGLAVDAAFAQMHGPDDYLPQGS